MKSLLLFIFLALPATALAEDPLPLGSEMPLTEVSMEGFAGDTERAWTLSDVQGEAGTLVIFTCNHCPYVKAWQERVVAHGNAYAEKGFGVIAINSNDPVPYPDDDLEGMKARAAEQGMQYPYVVDATSEMARAFGAKKTPELFLFDKTGKLVYHGAFDDNGQHPDKVEKPYLKLAMDALLAGEPVAVAESKAMGCSIKFRDKK